MFDSFASVSRFDFIGRWYDAAKGRDKGIETEASTTSCNWREDEPGIGDYQVTYVYQVNGEYFDGSFRTTIPYDRDTVLSVRYKPTNPKRNYLSGMRSGRDPFVLAAVGLGFGIIWLILKMMSLGYF